jgi:putative hemolysin
MGTVLASVAILIALIVANGIFAMSEFALVSARETRLSEWADQGSAGAKAALDLMEDPGRFLATIQIGITFVGITAGAFGEATLAGELEVFLKEFPALSAHAHTLAGGIIVLVVTYFTLIIGELVPKEVGLAYDARVSTIISRPLKILGFVTAPLVSILDRSTEAVCSLLHIEHGAQLIDKWRAAGVLAPDEEEMIEGLLALSNRRASSVMTARPQIIWVDVNATEQELRDTLISTPVSLVPVCDGDLDEPIGIVRVRDIFARLLHGETVDLRQLMDEALYVPASMPAIKLLEEFRKGESHLALALDEHGEVEGLITPVDLMQSVVGDLVILSPDIEPRIEELGDGSSLADAMLPVERFAEHFGVDVPSPSRRTYHTLAGLVLSRIKRMPDEGDHIMLGDHCVQIVDMDGRRIDKLRVIPPEDGQCSLEDDEVPPEATEEQ